MSKLRYLIYGLAGALVLMCSPIFVQAENSQPVRPDHVIINELAWAGSGLAAEDEYLELYNPTDSEVDISGWQITKKSAGKETLMLAIEDGKIAADGYYLISRYDIGNSKTILNLEPDLVSSSLTLSNTDLMITLYDQPFSSNPSDYVDRAGAGGKPPAGENGSGEGKSSMERNVDGLDGADPSSWHSAIESINFISDRAEKGSPKTENSIPPVNLPPSAPVLLSPANMAEIESASVDFSWQPSVDPNGDKIQYELYLNCDGTFGDADAVASELAEVNFSYNIENLTCNQYFWRVLASDGQDFQGSETFSFTKKKIAYADHVRINELYPDPSGDATDEWIELYNDSDAAADISGWGIEDLSGSTHQYIFPEGTVIGARGYFTLARVISKITLNNDCDGVRLTRPDGISYQTPLFADGDKDWAFALNGGSWVWTTTPTANKVNTITAPEPAIGGDDEEENDTPNNTDPIDIKTGDVSDHNNDLVRIQGKVTETSGDTFYIDDGSGVVKVYIQAKTGIEKPVLNPLN